MNMFNKSMRKYWNKNESVLLSTDIFTRRLLIITDEYLDRIDYNDKGIFEGCRFSFYNLEVVAINFMRNYDRFMHWMMGVMENDKIVGHQFKYLRFSRVVAFRMSEKWEKLMIDHLRYKNSMSEISIFDSYETKDKIDFIKSEMQCPYFRKPLLLEGDKCYMDNPESRDKAIFCGNYFTTFLIDFRLGEEEEEKLRDLEHKKEGEIRTLFMKGYDRMRDYKRLDEFKMKVTAFKLWPQFPKLSVGDRISINFTETIKYLCIGYDFKNDQLSTKQAEIQGKSFTRSLKHFPNLKYLMVWGFPLSSVLLALSLYKMPLECLKVVAGSYHNYHFDSTIGELH
jgi:hypothetical protein